MFKEGWAENLNALTAALQSFPQLAERAQAISEMPAATIEANVGDKSSAVCERPPSRQVRQVTWLLL
jgi:hypothetical protein